jgi:hypothetical protein
MRAIALGGLSLAMVVEGAGCALMPTRKVPPEPPYSTQTEVAPSPAGFGSQAPTAMNYGSGAPSDSMPPLGSYGPGGMTGGQMGAGLPATNPALSGGMPGPADPSVNPALGLPGSMPGDTAPAGYAPAAPPASYSPIGASAAPSGYASPGGYSSPMPTDGLNP